MAVLTPSRVREGSSHAQGAIWDGKDTNFTLFSAHATKVEVCLFDRLGVRELERIVLPEYTDEIWHGYIPDVNPADVYGFRVHGPYDPQAGNDRPLHDVLSQREFQIFHKIAAGRAVSAIGKELCLSVKTISTYRSRILEKMNMVSNADITTYALRNQLIQ